MTPNSEPRSGPKSPTTAGEDQPTAEKADTGGENRGQNRTAEDPGSRDAADRTRGERPARNWYRVLARPGEGPESQGRGDPPPEDDTAREWAIEHERRRGRPALAAAPNQKGYDIRSEDPLRGVIRLIEVKGLQQRWTGDATVTLTGAQFDASRGPAPPGCEYWLYVVDGLGTESPRVHPLLRPTAKVDRVYLQAEDWLGEVDQADRDRLPDAAVAGLGIPVVDYAEIANRRPTSVFLTKYPKADLADIVPVGGFLKCDPLGPAAELPAKGRLVMLLPSQLPPTGARLGALVGEFRWSLRQSLLEGDFQYVEVSLRPKTGEPGFNPVTVRIGMAEWPHFRPFAVCEPVRDA